MTSEKLNLTSQDIFINTFDTFVIFVHLKDPLEAFILIHKFLIINPQFFVAEIIIKNITTNILPFCCRVITPRHVFILSAVKGLIIQPLDNPSYWCFVFFANLRLCRSWRCSCLVTWFCYQLIAKPGNKTDAPWWPDHYAASTTGIISIMLTWRFMNMIHNRLISSYKVNIILNDFIHKLLWWNSVPSSMVHSLNYHWLWMLHSCHSLD